MKYLRFFTAALIACLLLPSAYGQVVQDSVRLNVEKFSKALNNKDVELATQCLAPHFSLSVDTWPTSKKYLQRILELQGIESVELTDKAPQKQGDVTLFHVNFHLQNKPVQPSIIGVDASHRICFVDYFDRLYGVSRFRKSVLAGVIPFERQNEYIVLKLRINGRGRELKFLLDTGADGMAIRKELADSLGLKVSHAQSSNVVGGQVEVNISQGNTVHLSDTLLLENQNIALFQSTGSTDGIIGTNLLRKFITSVNFDKQEIELYTFGNHVYADKGYTFPISNPTALILVPSSLDLIGKGVITGRFIMDTGADYNLILFSTFVRKNRLLLTGFKPEGESTTVSMGRATPVFFGKAHEFKVGDQIVQRNTPITLQASSEGGETGSTMPDGSIGIHFFSKYNFTIDMVRKELHLVPRTNL